MQEVEFELAIDGVPLQLSVREVTLTERLNGLPICNVRAQSRDPAPRARDLLQKPCQLHIRRGPEERSFRGIVWQARTEQLANGDHQLDLRLTTAAQLLTRIVDTYMYPSFTVPEIVKDIFERHLGRMPRTVDLSLLQRSYPTREYTLQYHETAFDFIRRLCEEEGIFFFFDHSATGAQHEVLMLADKTGNLPRARDQGVPHVTRESEDEGVTLAEHVEEVGFSSVVLDGYDWTNRDSSMRREPNPSDTTDPRLELYDPHDSMDYYDYRNQHYEGNSGGDQHAIRTELLEVERQAWRLECNVVVAQPGHLLKLTGAPDSDLDQDYLIISVTSSGSADDGQNGVFDASVHCAPSSMPYRPPRVTPRPTVHGPETARVVGGASDEIHTDEHGRIKVQFHWDRQHQRNEQSSCWIRVAQSWAGAGFGTLFIPRVDMEVMVTFLGGNPDRPVVTGCVYNDQNRPNVALPQDKSQSAIRTKSTTPGGGGASKGYNEILFEDKLGAEFISVHAQRDLLEEVLRDRTTQVRHNDRLTVTNSSYTRIQNTETRTVDHDARWTYKTSWSRNINYLETWIGAIPDGSAPGEFYRNFAERTSEFGKLNSPVVWSEVCGDGGRRVEFKNGSSEITRVESGQFLVHNAAPGSTPQNSTWFGLDAFHRTIGMRADGIAMSAAAGARGSGSRMYLTELGTIIRGHGTLIEKLPCSVEVTAHSIDLKYGEVSRITIDASGIVIKGPVVRVSGAVVTRGGKPTWD